jgi:hypothetical protein
MASSGMLRRVTLVITDVSVECIASVIRVAILGVLRLLVTANVIPSSQILITLVTEAIRFSEKSVVTRATRHSS